MKCSGGLFVSVICRHRRIDTPLRATVYVDVRTFARKRLGDVEASAAHLELIASGLADLGIISVLG